MEQLYMIEILVDKVSVFVRDDDPESNPNKRLVLKFMFGPKTQITVKEGQMVRTKPTEDLLSTGDDGMRKYTRTIRVGKSYLFTAHPDTLGTTLGLCPLEIELWTDDEHEVKEMIGSGVMKWNTNFYQMLRENLNPKKIYPSMAVKQRATINLECCCVRLGIAELIVRLSSLGDSVITEFQQLIDSDNPESFTFRTNKRPTQIKCKRIDGDDPNFCMLGCIYESVTLEDPEVVANAFKKIDICTELNSCGTEGGTNWCKAKKKAPKEYPIEKIRMGDILGPCGNPNCELAHRVKAYIRTLQVYKSNTKGKDKSAKPTQKQPCGQCGCPDDTWHRGTCPTQSTTDDKPVCAGCGGKAMRGQTCEDKVKKIQQVSYVTSIIRDSELVKPVFRQDFIVNPCRVNNTFKLNMANMDPDKTERETTKGESTKGESSKKEATDESKEYTCNPPVPTPPCKTFDCVCLPEAVNTASRNNHRPFCPSYQHKPTCPVTTMNDEEFEEEKEDEEPEPLPYGLPPIQLGPCPILGRPCALSDGFARMYKAAVMPTQPPSWSEAGKVCCSKEYERIRKAMKEYLAKHKNDDYRCLHKFNLDTERKCCDKEQRLLALTGKSCCGSFKLKEREHK